MTETLGHREAVAVEPLALARDWLGLVIPVASVLGMVVSAYLTWVHWSGSKALCAGVGDCEAVNFSAYAEVSGIPVALLGFGMYLALLGLSVYGRRAESGMVSTVALAVFGISLAGVLYSAYLTYIELAVLHAVCPWCVASAALITVIFGLSLRDVVRMTGES
ncbi:MAG: vitamin K epoxide reductase family protein [Anaerolineae bacterium]